jgi:hypothetical protein
LTEEMVGLLIDPEIEANLDTIECILTLIDPEVLEC